MQKAKVVLGVGMAAAVLTASSVLAAAAPATDLVSHSRTSSSEGSTTGPSIGPVISDTGSVIAFSDSSGTPPNMVSGYVDHGNAPNLYVWNGTDKTVHLVNHKAGLPAEEADAGAQNNAVSADGKFIAFVSNATNMISGLNYNSGTGSANIYIYTVADASIRLVSHIPGDPLSTANDSSTQFPGPVGISDDGTKVLFQSAATDLISPFVDTNGSGSVPVGSDLYLYDTTTDTNVLVTHASNLPNTGSNGSITTEQFRLSGDGNRVVYTSDASTLVAPFTDNNGSAGDVYEYDAATGLNTLVTHSAFDPTQGQNGVTSHPTVNTKGTKVAFDTTSNNLMDLFGDTNGSAKDVFVWDSKKNKATLVSHTAGDKKTSGEANSENAFINASGSTVAYESKSNDLVTGFQEGYLTGQPDIYRWTAKKSKNSLVTRRFDGKKTGQAGIPQLMGLSSSGGQVLYITQAPTANVVAGATDGNTGGYDAYEWDASAAKMRLISHKGGDLLTSGNQGSSEFGSSRLISSNGKAVVYLSPATDLLTVAFTNNNGAVNDIYRYGPATQPE